MSHAVIDSPANWLGPEIEKRTDWIHHLGKDEVDEIEQALSSVKARGISIAEVNRENFALRRFPRIAQRALETLENGPGISAIYCACGSRCPIAGRSPP